MAESTDNSKIVINQGTKMRLTPVKTTKGNGVRLEIPGVTVEVLRLKIETARRITEIEGAEGGTFTVRAFEKLNTRVLAPVEGQILEIKGNLTFGCHINKDQELLRIFNSDLQQSVWVNSPVNGVLLDADVRESLLNRHVKANEPLLRIGKESPGSTAE